MIKYIKLMVIAIAMSSTSFAGSDFKLNKEVVVDNCRFRDSEFQLDLFGSGAFYKQGEPAWGGGIGVNYFFLKYIGIGAEQTLVGREDVAEWGTFGNLFLRYPICSWNLAPYAVVGLGALYGQTEAILAGTVGGGLEYRITDNVGIFADARWLYNANVSNSGAVGVRTGLKFAF